MKIHSFAFWTIASLMAAIIFLPEFGLDRRAEDTAVGNLFNKGLFELVQDSWSTLWHGRFVLVIFCAYLMARLQVAAGKVASNQESHWKKKGTVKVYGDPPWSRTKTGLMVIASIALTLSLASTISFAAGLGAFTILLFGSIGGTGFRIIVDDKVVDWNGLRFTWDRIESWTRNYVPEYQDESGGYGETWYLSVRLTNGQTLECEDAHGEFSEPFREHAPNKYRDLP